MRNVLVTGAAGLYGRQMVMRLAAIPGLSVIGVDDMSRRFLVDPDDLFRNVDGNFELRRIRYQDITPELIDGESIDTVIHFAASISIPESMESPLKEKEYQENNACGTLGLLQAMNASQMRPFFIHASSPEVYGNPQYTPMDEDHPLKPESIYAESKVAIEMMIHAYQDWHHYPAAIVRNFNTYGPNQNLWKDAAVVTRFIYNALNGIPIEIHGDGRQTRDFQFVGDATGAYELIATAGPALSGQIFNIGTGVQTSIAELAELVRDVTNSKSEIVYRPGRPADLLALQADTSRIRNKTGWSPQYDLRRGLEETIPWYDNAIATGAIAGAAR